MPKEYMIRLPLEISLSLMQRLDERCEHEGKSKAKICREAIEQYLEEHEE